MNGQANNFVIPDLKDLPEGVKLSIQIERATSAPTPVVQQVSPTPALEKQIAETKGAKLAPSLLKGAFTRVKNLENSIDPILLVVITTVAAGSWWVVTSPASPVKQQINQQLDKTTSNKKTQGYAQPIPEFAKNPTQAGKPIGKRFKVGTGVGHRVIYINGKRQEGFHRGVDVGTPLNYSYATPAHPSKFNPDGSLKGDKEKIQVVCSSEPSGAGYFATLTNVDPNHPRLALRVFHLSRPCKSGRYKPGEEFGLAGSTGNSSGPHLHLEYWIDGVHASPPRNAPLWITMQILRIPYSELDPNGDGKIGFSPRVDQKLTAFYIEQHVIDAFEAT